MREIPLTQGKVALVDDDDYEWLMQWGSWCAALRNGLWYAAGSRYVGNYKSEYAYMHRLILGLTRRTDEGDHRDGDGLNNQRWNLRKATRSQQLGNTKLFSTNTSGHRGVVWDKARQKWVAQITIHRKNTRLGRFSSIDDAVAAYEHAAQIHFGEFKKV